jgi:hypothetical protein
MLSMDSPLSEDAAAPSSSSSSSCSERRLAANRANAQLSTGPRTDEGKAKSSLNAVKTGLCGRALLLADEEEARAYREHVERVYEWWTPANVEEQALVQSLADTQWRLESIPGLESALYAQARLRGEPVRQHADATIQRLLLDAQAEVAEAKALKNLRLHERRLRRQYEKDKAELNELRNERLEREEQEQKAEAARQQEEARRQQEAEAARQQQEARQQRRQERAQKRAERRTDPGHRLNGFEFATSGQTALTPLTVPGQEH